MENIDFESVFETTFSKLGTNKKHEIKRLIFEIAKIKNIEPFVFLNSIKDRQFRSLKEYLLSQRYPKSFNKSLLNSFYLPQYNIDPSLKADVASAEFKPDNIYYEKSVSDSFVFENVKKKFENSSFIEIDSLKNFCKEKKFTAAEYNKRCKNLFLIKEQYDFYKVCPCAADVKNCGYCIVNLGMGCPFECSYCFLQGYQNIPGISLISNIEDFLTDEKILARQSAVFNYQRIGSGEWMDSLAFDDITQNSKLIINYFRDKKDVFFEFKTKSANIEHLPFENAAENIVIAWSLNSFKMAKENEFKSASIEERIFAAKKCAEAGFSIGFHFDPIIYYLNWEKEYKEIIDMVFDNVPSESIKWISLGSLRMPFALKKIIENRFPQNSILDGELLLGKDLKLRYDKKIRIDMYKLFKKNIEEKKSKAVVYLCMENEEIWKAAGLL